MNLDDIIATLPPKGKKRIDAIIALSSMEKPETVLFQLAQTEKGKCKTEALKLLAQFNYTPSGVLWRKLVRGKYMGEAVLMPSCSNVVSQEIAPVIKKEFEELISLPKATCLTAIQLEKLSFSISIMLGKASLDMLDVYRFIAQNNEWFSHLKVINNEYISLVDGFIRIWNPTKNELSKVFPAVLTASIVKSKDERLFQLAHELYDVYGGPWLMPSFMTSILTKSKEEVFTQYAPLLANNVLAIYLFNVFGMINYADIPREMLQYYPDFKKGYEVLIFWGSYSYGLYDTRCSFNQLVELDTRWISLLAVNPHEMKPKVTLQTYNRRMGGVKYEDFDEMLLGLLPLEMDNSPLKEQLTAYFSIRSKQDDGETSLYKDVKQRFNLD